LASAVADDHHEHMVALSARSLTKVFDNGVTAVDGVDLDVASGEFMVLLGPTGCGKSTLLRLIAGFDEPTSGEVLFDGVPVTGIAPRDRDIAMVFQNYALYPHLTVAQNIGFPLRSGTEPADNVPARIAEAARNLGITDLLNRLPAHLSGGQQQRVAMARAIVRRPSVLLLDEPMSNVDAAVRAELRGEIRGLAGRLEVTTVYVTHDQSEAMSMADRVALLRLGVLQQVGPPEEVYADPQTVFVAAFLGTPRTSLLEAALYAEGESILLDLGGQVLTLPWTEALARHHTERITVGLRALKTEPSDLQLAGTVTAVENLGHEMLARVDIGGVPTPPSTSRLGLPERASAQVMPSTQYGFYPAYEAASPEPGGAVYARIPAPARVARGDEITMGVAVGDLLLFDRAGRRITFFDR
jgi:multiple sugar transport system ATP-binding protein